MKILGFAQFRYIFDSFFSGTSKVLVASSPSLNCVTRPLYLTQAGANLNSRKNELNFVLFLGN